MKSNQSIKFVILMSLFINHAVLAALLPLRDDDKRQISWKNEVYDFGKIKKGIPVEKTFEFVNTSEKPVVITKVVTSCGCTAADYTKDTIKPGGKGQVKVQYNAANVGTFSKTISVYTSSEKEAHLLNIKGHVED